MKKGANKRINSPKPARGHAKSKRFKKHESLLSHRQSHLMGPPNFFLKNIVVGFSNRRERSKPATKRPGGRAVNRSKCPLPNKFW